MRCALVDTNVLIGYLDPDDAQHDRAVRGLEETLGKQTTTWPVIAEAAHILGRRGWRFQEALLAMIEGGSLTLAPLTEADAPRIRALMSKYRNRPMDLADATLLRVAERDGIDTIVSLDRDFHVYRAAGIGALKILPRS
ncbi:MAG: PIN domain-containing protein [Elusimicrobiota bacterium]|nr:PIN domain-containing protein [Elusimicrobiota bacterium]